METKHRVALLMAQKTDEKALGVLLKRENSGAAFGDSQAYVIPSGDIVDSLTRRESADGLSTYLSACFYRDDDGKIPEISPVQHFDTSDFTPVKFGADTRDIVDYYTAEVSEDAVIKTDSAYEFIDAEDILNGEIRMTDADEFMYLLKMIRMLKSFMLR